MPLNQSQRPLYNAVKYATSFPVIYLSTAQRIVVSDLVAERGGQVRDEPWHGEHRLFPTIMKTNDVHLNPFDPATQFPGVELVYVPPIRTPKYSPYLRVIVL